MTFMDQNNPFSFIFGTKPGAGVPTYEQLQMRRKIAESLLGQKTRYPKTFGEGLSAIGEAIGERGMMSRLEDMEQAKAAQDKATIDAIDSPSPAPPVAPMARPMSYASAAPPLPAATPIPGMAGTPTPVEDGGFNALDQGANLRDGPWAARSAAIAGIESGGAKNPYALMGVRTRTGDRAHGKYQVMGANVPGWTAAALGQPMTPQAFLASPEAQEAVFKHRFGGYVDRYGEEGAAKAWFAGEKGMNNPSATDVHGRLTVRDYGQDYLKRLGPRSDVVDPTLNQSVALNPTEPPLPSGPPTAFSGQPVSDAPPIGMPDARDAITSALAPKPPPVVAPAAPPAPLGPQIAQAPPQQQIRVPEREPVPPPPPQVTDRMRKIQKAMDTIGDPLLRGGLAKRLELEVLNQKAIYEQQFEEYKHKRNLWVAAPEKEAARKKAEQDYRKGGLDIKKAEQELISAAPAAVADQSLLGTARSPQRTGIPVPEPQPPNTIAKNWAESQQKKIEETAAGLDAAKPELKESLDIIRRMREHPAKDWSIGTFGSMAKLTASGRGFAALDEQLKGKNLVAAYQKVKGSGTVGQVEGENLAKAQSALNTATTKEDYDSALKVLEGTLRGAVERAERKMNRPVTAYQQGPNDPYAPDIGQPSPGGTKIYVGGDPADPNNWKDR